MRWRVSIRPEKTQFRSEGCRAGYLHEELNREKGMQRFTDQMFGKVNGIRTDASLCAPKAIQALIGPGLPYRIKADDVWKNY